MGKALDRKIILTDDGSHSIFIPELKENYHSTHGAIQESKHVFLQAGFNAINKKNLRIVEVGFGTGLNALLTLMEASRQNKSVHYYSLEKYPLSKQEYGEINFGKLLGEGGENLFLKLHDAEWETDLEISPNFVLHKTRVDLKTVNYPHAFDLVYFDAFAPQIQADLWTVEVFKNLFDSLNEGGVLVTYSAKGQVRRNLIEAGFEVKKIPGPPGKREMLRAIKT